MLSAHDATMWGTFHAFVGGKTSFANEAIWYSTQRFDLWVSELFQNIYLFLFQSLLIFGCAKN